MDRTLCNKKRRINFEKNCFFYTKETECLSQNTNGEREITLITCTTGAIKRLIIKAIELYD